MKGSLFWFAIVALFLPRISQHTALIPHLFTAHLAGAGCWDNRQCLAEHGQQGHSSWRIGYFPGSPTALSNLLGSISAILAGIALVQIKNPYNYSAVFIAAFICFVLSWISINQTKEVPRKINWIPFTKTNPKLISVKSCTKIRHSEAFCSAVFFPNLAWWHLLFT